MADVQTSEVDTKLAPIKWDSKILYSDRFIVITNV
jgi:hypothetical protein